MNIKIECSNDNEVKLMHYIIQSGLCNLDYDHIKSIIGEDISDNMNIEYVTRDNEPKTDLICRTVIEFPETYKHVCTRNLFSHKYYKLVSIPKRVYVIDHKFPDGVSPEEMLKIISTSEQMTIKINKLKTLRYEEFAIHQEPSVTHCVYREPIENTK